VSIREGKSERLGFEVVVSGFIGKPGVLSEDKLVGGLNITFMLLIAIKLTNN
jgi:hypothetical protein